MKMNFKNRKLFSGIIIITLFLINNSYLQAQSFDYNNGINTKKYLQDLNLSFLYNQNQFYSIESNSLQAQSSDTAKSSKPLNYDTQSIKRRRNMLDWHQIAGIATWFSWLATNIAGENAAKNYHREFEPYARAMLILNPTQNSTQSFMLYQYIMNVSPWDTSDSQRRQHSELAYTTFTLYAVTASLAFLSPSSVNLEREPGWSTIFTHKAMIFIHLPAMLALPVLGADTKTGGPASVHRMQEVGWTGFSALSVAMFAFYF
jgi:hypothetical protein